MHSPHNEVWHRACRWMRHCVFSPEASPPLPQQLEACQCSLSLSQLPMDSQTPWHTTPLRPTRWKLILMSSGPTWWRIGMRWRWLHHSPSFMSLFRPKGLHFQHLPLCLDPICAKFQQARLHPALQRRKPNTRPSGLHPKLMSDCPPWPWGSLATLHFAFWYWQVGVRQSCNTSSWQEDR